MTDARVADAGGETTTGIDVLVSARRDLAPRRRPLKIGTPSTSRIVLFNIPKRVVEHPDSGLYSPHAMDITSRGLDTILSALGEQLGVLGARLEMVVIGGSALLALGLVTRPTKDVDVVAFAEGEELRPASPLPQALAEAKDRVARDFALPQDWLNAGPTDLLRWGLPEGFWGRVTTRRYGETLTVHFAGRLDQVHFKLYAMVDQSGGRHEADLRALRPSRDELVAAARWSITHDPSPGYRMMLEQALERLGVEDVDLGA
jgi:hypothetical protein